MPLAAIIAVWFLACVGGIVWMWNYKATAGPGGDPPDRWPDGVALARLQGAPTLVMLVHPRCPCSRASMTELNQVMHHAPGIKTFVLFSVPADARAGWEDGDTWRRAHQIPGVTAVVDKGGVMAARFGAVVSGHVVLYDGDGVLRFTGGITGSRGHEGENVGRDRLMAALKDASATASSKVYGCELVQPDE